MVAEDGSAALQDPVQRLGDADVEPLHAAGERLVVVCLDDDVQVVAEYGELDEPHPESCPRGGERALQRLVAAAAAEIPDVMSHAQGHGRRKRLPEPRRRGRRAPPPAGPAGSGPAPAVPGKLELARHFHDFGRYHPSPWTAGRETGVDPAA